MGSISRRLCELLRPNLVPYETHVTCMSMQDIVNKQETCTGSDLLVGRLSFVFHVVSMSYLLYAHIIRHCKS